MTSAWRVLWDYQVPRLNGKNGVVWVEGDVVDLVDDDAAWVNRDRPGTLEPADQPDEVPADEVPAEQPADEPEPAQPAAAKPARRRKDSAS